jgi:hypothetical protein
MIIWAGSITGTGVSIIGVSTTGELLGVGLVVCALVI